MLASPPLPLIMCLVAARSPLPDNTKLSCSTNIIHYLSLPSSIPVPDSPSPSVRFGLGIFKLNEFRSYTCHVWTHWRRMIRCISCKVQIPTVTSGDHLFTPWYTCLPRREQVGWSTVLPAYKVHGCKVFSVAGSILAGPTEFYSGNLGFQYVVL